MQEFEFADKDNEAVTIRDNIIHYKHAAITLPDNFYVLITCFKTLDHALVEISSEQSPYFNIVTSKNTAATLSKWPRCKSFVES